MKCDTVKMFGCSEAVLENNYSVDVREWSDGSKTLVAGMMQIEEPEMFAMSIMSDAQELMARDRVEEARQYINRAKHVLGQAMKLKRSLQTM